MAPPELRGAGALGPLGPVHAGAVHKQSNTIGDWRPRYCRVRGRRLYHYDTEEEAAVQPEYPDGFYKGWLDCVGMRIRTVDDGAWRAIEVVEDRGALVDGGAEEAPLKMLIGWRRDDERDVWMRVLALARRPAWLPDRDPRAARCQHSHAKFGLFRRRHHCRRCGGVFAAAATRWSALPELLYDMPVLVCDPCAVSGAAASRWLTKRPAAARRVKQPKPAASAGVSAVASGIARVFGGMFGSKDDGAAGGEEPTAAAHAPPPEESQALKDSIAANIVASAGGGRPEEGLLGMLGIGRRADDDLTGWQKGELLGEGSFGTVHRALLRTGRFVAVKRIPVSAAAGAAPDAVADVVTELALMRRLRHPNVAEFLGATPGAEGASVLIFMELVSGGSLYSVRSRFGALPPLVMKAYARDMFAGLAYLHAEGIVHRDVKGRNVLIQQQADSGGGRGIAKLCDFGASKRICDLSRAAVVGTPYWMAPEVLTVGPGGYGARADVWGAGCTVVEMVTGAPPWRPCKSTAAACRLVASGVFPNAVPQDLPPALRRFVATCLRRDPADRPDAATLLSDAWITTDRL